jgi:hypothetical protein
LAPISAGAASIAIIATILHRSRWLLIRISSQHQSAGAPPSFDGTIARQDRAERGSVLRPVQS